MTVHEQYDIKKAQYMKYNAEVEVYKTQLNKATDALKEKLADLSSRTSVVEDTTLRNRIELAIENVNKGLKNFDTQDALDEAMKELAAVASILEQQIMRALND